MSEINLEPQLPKFVAPDNPILHQPAQEVELSRLKSFEIQEKIKKMTQVFYGNQEDKTKPVMVGLAGQRIGIPENIIMVVTNPGEQKPIVKVMINAKITKYSDQKHESRETCFSVGPDIGGIVPRSETVTVEYDTPDGIHTQEEVSGRAADFVQHEVGHTEGQLFLSLIDSPQHLHDISGDGMELWRQNWKDWKNLANPSQVNKRVGRDVINFSPNKP